MEIQKFNIEFVQRTKDILISYKGDYEFSNLINCTPGLLILPYQIIQDNPSSYWLKPISQVSNTSNLNIFKFEPIRRVDNNKITYYPKNLKVLLQKIRNGLAHQHIEPINDSGILKSIKIRNYFEYKGGNRIMDLEIQFTEQELRSFSLYIADAYLSQA
jgi:hypothetical protein